MIEADEKDDRLLAALGHLERERDAAREVTEDPRWHALAEGRLGPAEAEALRTEQPDEYELYRPQDGAAKDRIIARFAPAATLAFAAPRRLSRVLARVALGTAAAAATVLFLWRPVMEDPAPTYVLALEAGDQQVRSGKPDDAATPTLAVDSVLSLVVRPTQSIDEQDVEARAFFVQGGRVEEMTARPVRSSSGTFALRGPIVRLLGAVTGPVEVVIVVGRPAAFRSLDETRLLNSSGERLGDLWVQRRTIIVRGR